MLSMGMAEKQIHTFDRNSASNNPYYTIYLYRLKNSIFYEVSAINERK